MKIKCEFCSKTFANDSEKNAHIPEHFAQENCIKCNKKLIRIGDTLYVVHTQFTCIKSEIDFNDENTQELEQEITIVQPVEINDVLTTAVAWKEELPHDIIDDHTDHPADDDDFPAADEDTYDSDVPIESETIFAEDMQTELITSHAEPVDNPTQDEIVTMPTDDETKIPSEPPASIDIKEKTKQLGATVKKLMSKLRRRVWKNSYDDTSVKCTFDGCDKMIKRRAIYRHMAMHRGIRFTCDICNTSLSTKRVLINHMAKHNPTERPICEICGRTFATKQVLRKHSRIIHKTESQYIIERNAKSEILKRVIEQAEQAIQDPTGIKNELIITPDVINYVPRKRKKPTPEEIKRRREQRRIYKNNYDSELIKCDVEGCNDWFKRRAKYDHMGKHGSTALNCNICNLRFETIRGCREHKRKHGGDNKIQKNFKNVPPEIQLSRREQRRIWKNKYDSTPIQCEYDGCGDWIRRGSIYKHMAKHSGSAPVTYTCDLCNATLKTKYGLKTHMEKHISSVKQRNG